MVSEIIEPDTTAKRNIKLSMAALTIGKCAHTKTSSKHGDAVATVVET